MTVGQLIARLLRFPRSTEVRLVYDSQVMCVAIKYVGNWNASWGDEPKIVVGLFDDEPDKDDDRRQAD